MLKAFFNWFSDTFLNCRDAVRLVSESHERVLTLSERLKLRILCLMCPYTARYEKQVGVIHKHAGQCGEDISGLSQEIRLSEESKERMRGRVRAETGS